MKVLQVALENRHYDLAAHALVLALVKVSRNGSQPHAKKKLTTKKAKPLS